MERLDPNKPVGPEDLFESIREVRVKTNEIIAERDILIERVAKAECDLDKIRTENALTDKALMKTINQLALHKHAASTGEAMQPLAI